MYYSHGHDLFSSKCCFWKQISWWCYKRVNCWLRNHLDFRLTRHMSWITLVRYARSQHIGKPYNLKVFLSKKIKGSKKQNSKSTMVTCAEGRLPFALMTITSLRYYTFQVYLRKPVSFRFISAFSKCSRNKFVQLLHLTLLSNYYSLTLTIKYREHITVNYLCSVKHSVDVLSKPRSHDCHLNSVDIYDFLPFYITVPQTLIKEKCFLFDKWLLPRSSGHHMRSINLVTKAINANDYFL